MIGEKQIKHGMQNHFDNYMTEFTFSHYKLKSELFLFNEEYLYNILFYFSYKQNDFECHLKVDAVLENISNKEKEYICNEIKKILVDNKYALINYSQGFVKYILDKKNEAVEIIVLKNNTKLLKCLNDVFKKEISVHDTATCNKLMYNNIINLIKG